MDGAAALFVGVIAVFLSDSSTQNVRVERLQGGCGIRMGWVACVLWEFIKSEFCGWGLDSGSGRGAGVDCRGSQRLNSVTPACQHCCHVALAPSHAVRLGWA